MTPGVASMTLLSKRNGEAVSKFAATGAREAVATAAAAANNTEAAEAAAEVDGAEDITSHPLYVVISS
jgi:hypothetical protein